MPSADASQPALADAAASWPVTGSGDLHRDGWVVALRADQVQRPGHPEEEPFRRIVMEHPGAAVVLALDEQDRVLVLWQYRHAVGQVLVEIPAGLLDQGGETPEQVARRELVEETGWEASSWTHLVTTWPSPGISAERAHLFLARDLREVGRQGFVPEHEEAEAVTGWVPFEEVHAAVLDGRVQDAPVIIAVLAARARGLA
ncbi:NUDIX domain-containing protein [Nocardioides bruguierae]|uniref:NUDIX domain-containing protein n=1 Tax=Nocardioides bruguierae TaxID=2945102 RepID=UPI0020220A09|nr:NUDIX hydrolase [Nocardioides bruguierae]MCL8026067.1 NUDIX hydrolase [Nocardioides bruguierae]